MDSRIEVIKEQALNNAERLEVKSLKNQIEIKMLELEILQRKYNDLTGRDHTMPLYLTSPKSRATNEFMKTQPHNKPEACDHDFERLLCGCILHIGTGRCVRHCDETRT